MQIFDSFRNFVGRAIVSLPERNPIRRWFEQGWAEVDADRAAFAAKHGLRLKEDGTLLDADLPLAQPRKK